MVAIGTYILKYKQLLFSFLFGSCLLKIRSLFLVRMCKIFLLTISYLIHNFYSASSWIQKVFHGMKLAGVTSKIRCKYKIEEIPNIYLKNMKIYCYIHTEIANKIFELPRIIKRYCDNKNTYILYQKYRKVFHEYGPKFSENSNSPRFIYTVCLKLFASFGTFLYTKKSFIMMQTKQLWTPVDTYCFTVPNIVISNNWDNVSLFSYVRRWMLRMISNQLTPEQTKESNLNPR